MENVTQQGGCLCGAIRFRVTGKASSSSLCFCKTCRRAAGASPVAWFVVSIHQYELLAGRPRAYRSPESITRTFCPDCGTPLSYARDSFPDDIELTTASLDDPDAIPPTEEIWLSHRVQWACSNPELPHFAKDNPSM